MTKRQIARGAPSKGEQSERNGNSGRGVALRRPNAARGVPTSPDVLENVDRICRRYVRGNTRDMQPRV
jgi:hypothetical protein